MLLVLGDRRLLVREAERQWIYDFDRRRVRVVDARSMTYADWSLFGMVAFNDAELSRRVAASGPAASVRQLEALYSMTSSAKPRRGDTLADSSRGDWIDVRIHGQPFTSADLSHHVLPPERAAAFERFLLFHCHLHPVARRSLVRSRRLPATLEYRTVDGAEETIVSLRLMEVDSTMEASDPIRGLPRRDVTDPSFAVLSARLDGARSLSADSSRARRDAAMREFEVDAAREGRRLDVALSRLARAVERCEKPSLALWPSEPPGGKPDSIFLACLASDDSLSPARARRVAETLGKVDPATLTTASVVALQLGRALLAAGAFDPGVQHLLHGLEVHPCAVGAWVDLGLAFRRESQPVLAWLCFDAARALAPKGCAELAAGDRLENDLLKRRPEYFQ